MTSVAKEEVQGDSAIGNLLCGSWELVQKILENLSYYEVSKLRLVCRIWADVGEMILAKRRPLHYLTIHPHCIPTTHGKVAIGEASPASLLEGFFMHIVSKPRYCLAFCNANWLYRTDIFDHTGRTVPITITEYLHERLPLSCDLGVISATGIVGTVETAYQGHWLQCAQNMNQEILNFLEGTDDTPPCKPSKRARTEKTEEVVGAEETCGAGEQAKVAASEAWRSNVGYSIEVEQSSPAMTDADALSLIIIPHHPGVTMKFFDVSPVKFYSDFRGGNISSKKLVISEEEFNELMSLSPCDHLASLLLFDTCYDDNFTSGFVKAALNREDYEVALGGGVADAFQSGRTNKFIPTTDHIFGIAVTGPNIMAASVVIPASVENPKHLGRYMMKLKSCGLPEKQSVAFMFTCCGRGYGSWMPIPKFSYENVESKAFRRTFPNTPIFGFFGRGEIGITHLPKFPSADGGAGQKATPKKRRKAFHQYSTIIVLLSFL